MGYLANAFKKATLSTVLATSLVTGVGVNSAFAQQAGQPPQPSQGVTQQYGGPTVSVNSWQNDAHYQRLIEAYDAQVNARMKVYNVNREAQHRIGDATMQIQEANLEQGRANYMRSPQGWAQYGAAQAQISGWHEAQSVQIDAAYQNLTAREDMARSQYIQGLDNRFQALPQFKPGGAGPNQPKTWENDPQYRQQINNFDRQQDAVFRIDDANERAQMNVLNANHASQSITINTSQGPLVLRQGLPGIARLGATDEIMNATFKQQKVTVEATYEQKHAAMAAQREEFVFQMDQRFSQMPQYKQSAPTTQPRVRAPGS